MRPGVWGPFFSFSFLNLAEAAASAASMQFTALQVNSSLSPVLEIIIKSGTQSDSSVQSAVYYYTLVISPTLLSHSHNQSNIKGSTLIDIV